MASTIAGVLLGFGLAGASPSAALAQTASPSAAVGELIVTGTRLPSPDPTGVSPVTTVTDADIALSGYTRIEDLINRLPQAFAGQGGAVGNGASGTATVNLRGLGVQRTLVLIDGRRLAPGNPAFSGSPPVPDLNAIPAALVERIDVLTGGASATYGSDAVAGVVNFVLKKNFTGVRIDANAGFYDHDNGNPSVQAVTQASGIASPTGSRADGWQKDVTLTAGVDTPDKKGNLMGYFAYRQVDAVSQSQRDYGACPLAESGAGFACSGSVYSAQSHFLVFTPTGRSVGLPGGYVLDTGGPGNTVRPYTLADGYNYAPYNDYQRPDDRYSLGLLGHYDVNPHVELYVQAMAMDDYTSFTNAPSGIFGQLVQLPCASPVLSAQEVATFCTAAGQGARGYATLGLLKRNVEGGPRLTDIRHTDYRLVIGAKGEIDKTWSYDAYGQYGKSVLHETYTGDFSIARSTNAINGCYTTVVNPNGAPCAFYNAFAVGGVTQAALNYLSAGDHQSGDTTETVFSGSLTGKLGDYGLRSPWSADGVDLNVGAEYRRETLSLITDAEDQAGDLAGLAGVRLPVSGAFDVKELFVEATAPLARDKAGFKDLSLNTGYRYSDYSSAGRTDTYKVGGEWAPTSDIRFRAGFNHAVRAPSIQELYSSSGVVLDGTMDPCAGTTPTATAAQCALTGVTAAQYGHIAANTSNQYNGLEGGNPNLKPEKSDTTTLGFVVTPQNLPRFSFSLDHFDIKVTDVIGTAGADLILTQCLQTGNPFYCGKVVRAPGTGSLWLGSNGYVLDTAFNLGRLQTSGFDLAARYSLPLDRWGRVAVDFSGTLLDHFTTQPLPTGGSYDCAGRYGVICNASTGGAPAPKFRGTTRLTWDTPWAVSASAAWRHIDSVAVDSASSNSFLAGTVNPADATLPAFDYIDLTASVRIRQRYTLRLGVNNLMDLQPPLVGSGHLEAVYGNGNTYPEVYDALGRYVFMGLTAAF
jgi:outer membrane receptor protein involved in Fe transport